MSYRAYKKITLIYLLSILFYGCSPNNNIDIDLSNLPKPKSVQTNEEVNKDLVEKEQDDNKLFIKNLVKFKNREEILSNTKFSKKDPFSRNDTSNKFSSDFKLTGFFNTPVNKYVFVNYLNNEGTLSEDSIGGINTDLLPNGAKVIFIDPLGMKLKINFKNEDFVFELK